MQGIKTLVIALSMLIGMASLAEAKNQSKGLFRKWKSGTLNCHAVLWYTSSSSSTSDSCDHVMFIIQNKKDEIRHYVDTNYDNLMEDMSRGEGQFVNDYAMILGCPNHSQFSKTVQGKFTKIYSGDRDPQSVLNNTIEVMGQSSELKNSCQPVI
ncbi:MAG: DUF3015 family protein [Bdellovibrionales bacterium]|nr:DUF3015 family protein [Bdellovibrionales bacterium]